MNSQVGRTAALGGGISQLCMYGRLNFQRRWNVIGEGDMAAMFCIRLRRAGEREGREAFSPQADDKL